LPYQVTKEQRVLLQHQLILLNSGLVEAAIRVLETGPFERLWTLSLFDDTLADVKSTRKLTKLLRIEADQAAVEGDRAACLHALAANLQLANECRPLEGDLSFFLISSGNDSLADRSALTCVRLNALNRSDLREILDEVPRIGACDPAEARDIKVEFERALWVDSYLVRGTEKGFDRFAKEPGNFDALATAGILGDLFLAGEENAMRDWRHQSRDPAIVAARATSGIPDDLELDEIGLMEPADSRDQDSEQSGPGFWVRLAQRFGLTAPADSSEDQDPKPPGYGIWDRLSYRMKMNRIPNSIGRRVAGSFEDLPSVHAEAVANSTRQELVRAVVAIRLYMRDHSSRLPATLANLKTAGYLDAVPMDWFACAPLRYDPMRRIIYSIGRAGVDHGGKFRVDLESRDDSDLGAFLDQPKNQLIP
jgi:hypothetical protein